MKYFKDGNWFNDDTVKILPDGATLLSDAEWSNRQGIPYQLTQSELEEKRKQDIKDAGITLINTVFPALNYIDNIKFYAEFWASITPAARDATQDFQKVIDIYVTSKQALVDGTLVEDVVWP